MFLFLFTTILLFNFERVNYFLVMHSMNKSYVDLFFYKLSKLSIIRSMLLIRSQIFVLLLLDDSGGLCCSRFQRGGENAKMSTISFFFSPTKLLSLM